MSVNPLTVTFSSNGTKQSLADIETAVLRTVAYVDVFDYPLTAKQIHRYLEGVTASREDINSILANGRIVPHKLIRRDEYFMLPHREELVTFRQEREANSRQLWRQALRYGRIIAHLPFTRMVAVTGSLAMNNAEKDADIDYLVVTANGRLWLCRTFIIALVKLARRVGVELCPNYILAENSLNFTNHNLYTAHEVTQMVPLSGLDVYLRIREINKWTAAFLPNAGNLPEATDLINPGLIQKMMELPLRTTVGRWLNDWEMNRKIRRFQAQGTYPNETGFTADYCKGHFIAHNHRTIRAYHQRIERYL